MEPIGVQALIESATGLANIREIATASPRLRALVIGYADLGASLGRSARISHDRWLYAQETVLVAARTAGLAAFTPAPEALANARTVLKALHDRLGRPGVS